MKVSIRTPRGPSTTGRYEPVELSVRHGGGVSTVHAQAFLPEVLPPRSFGKDDCVLRFHDAIVHARERIALLEGIATNLGEPQLLSSLFVTREARLSSAIENTFANELELALAEVAGTSSTTRPDTKEVLNYRVAMQQCVDTDLPISSRLVKAAHATLMKGVRGQDHRPGEFRNIQNFIGSRSEGDISIRYVPPPPQYVAELVANLERFIHASDDGLPLLVKAAIAHYQFEAIHPFLDGNGRIGRMLASLQVLRQTELTRPFVYLSGFFEQSKATYYDLLLRVSEEGDWFSWIDYFLEAVWTQAEDARRRAVSLAALREEYLQALSQKRLSALLPGVVDDLFQTPAITAPVIAGRTGVTNAAAHALIRRLEEFGIVSEVHSPGRLRVWVANEIIDRASREFLPSGQGVE